MDFTLFTPTAFFCLFDFNIFRIRKISRRDRFGDVSLNGTKKERAMNEMTTAPDNEEQFFFLLFSLFSFSRLLLFFRFLIIYMTLDSFVHFPFHKRFYQLNRDDFKVAVVLHRIPNENQIATKKRIVKNEKRCAQTTN